MLLIKLKPACKDYIWGGSRLSDEYGKGERGERIAETWELSCFPDSPSVIENGIYAGKTLSQYIESEGRGVLGSKCKEFKDFPILVKFIDAENDLSIQVHPDNEYAFKHKRQSGKTEVWYILDSEEGAHIYYGFNREVSKEEVRERIENDTLTEVLNAIPVKAGDIIFIEAGTVHSIGKGILTVEIQQSSDITYRLYDYGRLGKDGRKRELHIDKALDVAKLAPVSNRRDFGEHMVKSEYFVSDKVEIDGSYQRQIDDSSFTHLLFLDGEGRISLNDESVQYKKGDSIFVPAGEGSLKIEGKGDVIITYI